MVESERAGVYLSIPFCKAKCSFCNFASGVFGAERMQAYVDRLCGEIAGAREFAGRPGAVLPERVDSIYFGGGTPSLLEPGMVGEIFAALRGEFSIEADAEVTVECAPGQLERATLERLLAEGMNRVSFGVQSFADRESAAVGRLHTGAECLAELERMRLAGVRQRSLDLIVGLPHQTESSWRLSVDTALGSGAEHVSVYMLEVDEGSRLGRELLGAGTRYGAGLVPHEDACADWYARAVEWLRAGGVEQYEISNFARAGYESRHNRKYWRREPYIGFGLDGHSMLRTGEGAVRWANPDSMEDYLAGAGVAGVETDRIGREAAFEETLFLGLRMNEGVDLEALPQELVDAVAVGLREAEEAGLVSRHGGVVKLTDAGRMVSNEVFGRLLVNA
jgi:oxygen-independent coproporphyrinogen-3 oxidase